MLTQSKYGLGLYCRLFCTKSKKKIGEIIKKYNYENKKLFGAALKLNNKKRNEDKVKEGSSRTLTGHINESEKISSEKSANSSEFYWLFRRHNGKKEVKLKKTAPQKEYVTDLKQNVALSYNKNKENIGTIIDEQIIPFKNVKDILKFPLILNTNYIETEIVPQNVSFNGRLPSVGKILQSTLPEASRTALINWKLKQISEIGIEGFISLQKDHLKKGKDLHAAIENFLLHKIKPEISSDMEKLWNSVAPALQLMQPMDIKLTEGKVNHPYLKYHGVVDCVSTIGNDVTIIEWKKSDKIKNNITATFDAPLQLCAYLGALNTDPQFSSLNINKGLVVVAYTNGKQAEIHRLDKNELQNYWSLWLKRVEEFWVRTRDNTLPEAI